MSNRQILQLAILLAASVFLLQPGATVHFRHRPVLRLVK
ncbi:hypothetical protein ABIB14_002671 [Arthrobacter sp. UYEF3]